MGETAALMAVKTGGMVMIITIFTTDINVMMSVMVGLIGGVFAFIMQYAHLSVEVKINTTKVKVLSELFGAIISAVSTAGISIFLGVIAIDRFATPDSYPMVWFIGLMTAYKHAYMWDAVVKIVNKKITS